MHVGLGSPLNLHHDYSIQYSPRSEPQPDLLLTTPWDGIPRSVCLLDTCRRGESSRIRSRHGQTSAVSAFDIDLLQARPA